MLFRDSSAPVEARIEDLLSRLTLEEKCKLCHGFVTPDKDLKFFAGGIERFDIPPISSFDGPVGVHLHEQPGRTTAMPCTLGLSCMWDVEAAYEYASVLADEVLAFNRHMLLAPGINLMRSPLCGRNFEYLGEDPLLSGKLAAAYCKGLQDKRVASDPKHLVANDQEQLRHQASSNLDDRTLREMHLLPFEIAFKEGEAWTTMVSNSLLNGIHVGENREFLQGIVKEELGWDGVVLTDWRGAYTVEGSAFGGTDMTTGVCAYVFGNGNLQRAVEEGRVPQSLLDEKVRRILRLYIRTGILDPDQRPAGSLNTPAHQEVARRLAAESIVLLKNENNLLPLDMNKKQRILVTGPGAEEVSGGKGSAMVLPPFSVTPLQGLQNAAGEQTEIQYVPYDAANPAPMLQAARSADVVVFFVTAKTAGEGNDMPDMNLLPGEAEIIQSVAEANSNTVAVILTGYPVVLEPWIDNVPAALSGWYGGQSTGDAIADVLSGKVNPSARLSFTWGKRLEDYAVHALGQWPIRLILETPPPPPSMKPEERVIIYGYDSDYTEGIFMGYRWFDEKKIEPRFPFGFGLSYTSFAMDSMRVEVASNSAADPRVIVHARVTNTGARAGAEIVQVYVSDPECSVSRPPRELKAFAKVQLQPGESKEVQMELNQRSFAFWSEQNHAWTVEPGEFVIAVGRSSREIAAEQSIQLS